MGGGGMQAFFKILVLLYSRQECLMPRVKRTYPLTFCRVTNTFLYFELLQHRSYIFHITQIDAKSNKFISGNWQKNYFKNVIAIIYASKQQLEVYINHYEMQLLWEVIGIGWILDMLELYGKCNFTIVEVQNTWRHLQLGTKMKGVFIFNLYQHTTKLSYPWSDIVENRSFKRSAEVQSRQPRWSSKMSRNN